MGRWRLQRPVDPGLPWRLSITASDHDPAGPFGSIAEALKHETVSLPISGLTIRRDLVPLETLLVLGAWLLDETEDEITINDRRYVRGAVGQLTEAAGGRL